MKSKVDQCNTPPSVSNVRETKMEGSGKLLRRGKEGRRGRRESLWEGDGEEGKG